MEGRREVPDSEDEPMTSSPTNVSDGDADKLFAMAHVPPQGAQDVPQEATRTHQVTPEPDANMNTERIQGLGADRNIASFNIDGTNDEQVDLQPTTTPSELTAAYNDTAVIHHPDTATFPRPGINLTPPDDAVVTNTAQSSVGTPRPELGTEPEPAAASETGSISAYPGVAYRDVRETVEPQLAAVNDQVPIDTAEAQLATEATSVLTNNNDGTEALVAAHLFKDNSTSNESREPEVGAVRLNDRRASHNELGMAADFRHATPQSEERLSQIGIQTPKKGKGDGADGAAQKMTANEGLHAAARTSRDTVDTMNAKHAVNIDDASDDNNILAAKPSLYFQEQSKEGSRADTTWQDLTTTTYTVSGTESLLEEESSNSPVGPNTKSEPRSSLETQASSQASMPGTIIAVAEPGIDMAINLDTAAHEFAGGPVQNRGEDQAVSSTFSTHNLTNAFAPSIPAERSPISPNEAPFDALNITIAHNVGETVEPAVDSSITASGPNSNPPVDTSVSNSTAPAVTTIAKTQQEITLDELRAQKSAMLASLAALPAIRVLMEENASSDVGMADVDDEATEADIMAAANMIVREHIKLLHEYNELKDVGQGLMGLIADQRGVRIIEVQEEFGIEVQD